MTGTDSSVTSTSQAVSHDTNHPYFLHSSDAPGMTLVTSPFDGRGFPGWRRSILIALSAKNKLAFINGICDEPALDSKDHAQWSRCNDMVTSWLLNSLTKEIGDSVIYSKSAKELWSSLEHRFGQSNGAKLYHLCVWREEESSQVPGGSESHPISNGTEWCVCTCKRQYSHDKPSSKYGSCLFHPPSRVILVAAFGWKWRVWNNAYKIDTKP